jgi:hypothetical protein
MYNKTNIKLYILTIKNVHREVGRVMDLPAPCRMCQYLTPFRIYFEYCLMNFVPYSVSLIPLELIHSLPELNT